jgi:hypothetical protein
MFQMHHQLLVSGAERCWFISYNPKCEKPLKYKEVLPDHSFFGIHLDSCEKFWTKVVNKTPPKPSEDDYVHVKFTGGKQMAEEYLRLSGQIKELEKEVEAIKEQILSHIKHPLSICGGLKIQRIDKIGSISYKDIPAIKDMDKSELEKYRGKSSSYYKLTKDV